jgi:indolepyruvate ferredoxin oxidoreductase beta subunit
MKKDIILAGVGGQGVLSIAAIIAGAAVAEGLKVRQSEVHGMAQRGGAVLAHLRLGDRSIPSDLAPRGEADLIISMEPMESLRYAAWLNPLGALVTAAEPLVNIPDYPDTGAILGLIRSFPVSRILEAAALAKEAGSSRAVNMVMAGAASSFLPLQTGSMEEAIAALFAARDPGIAALNIKAFRLGREAALQEAALQSGKGTSP